MQRDEFLDTNIVMNYINYNENSKKIVKKSYEYILSSNGRIILCGMVIKELRKLQGKKSRINKAVLKLLENENYDLSRDLSSREIPFAKKLYAKYKNIGVEKLSENFDKERAFFEIELDKFLKFKVKKIVISISEIDSKLVNKIYDLVPNIDDCKVLASALQYQKTQEKLFNFVTADNEDFFINGYDYLKEHFVINYSKENWKFPELVNLMIAN
jgi:predicted nucleic acid-binding protein